MTVCINYLGAKREPGVSDTSEKNNLVSHTIYIRIKSLLMAKSKRRGAVAECLLPLGEVALLVLLEELEQRYQFMFCLLAQKSVPYIFRNTTVI